MRKVSHIIIFILFYGITGMSQSTYKDECIMLKNVAFIEPFEHDKIEDQLKKFQTYLKTSTQYTYDDCNCADTMWIYELRDTRNFISYTHSNQIDTNSYLRNLSTRVDTMNLNKEFQLNLINNLIDSFKYVLDRLNRKSLRRGESSSNWQKFHHCIDAEVFFLKEYKYRLKDEYFRIFDDTTNNNGLRDLIISSYFYSDETIEEEILKRIPKYVGKKYFYRMLGILRTSGTEKSVEYLTNLLKINEFSLNTQKGILNSIHGIMDRRAVKKKVRKKFNKLLLESKLDTLSRYDLFIRN